MFVIELGVKVKDKITGFAGTVTGRCDYVTGCNQYLVQPTELKDRSVIEPRWLDENRLEVTDGAKLTLGPAVGATETQRFGADAPAPVK